MTRRGIAIVAGVLTGSISAAALAAGSGDWVVIKSPKELRALYSNTTLKGKAPDGSTWVGYYKADGHGVMIYKAHRLPRTWEVVGDRVCVTDPKTTNCFRYERNRLHPNHIFARQMPKGWAVWFTVKDGIPNF